MRKPYKQIKAESAQDFTNLVHGFVNGSLKRAQQSSTQFRVSIKDTGPDAPNLIQKTVLVVDTSRSRFAATSVFTYDNDTGAVEMDIAGGTLRAGTVKAAQQLLLKWFPAWYKFN